MTPIRILWVCFHRTARFEEVSALLRAGFEVVPTTGEFGSFPNAVNLAEKADPYQPSWRATCTVPAEVLQAVQAYAQYEHPESISESVIEKLDRWFDVVWVASFSRLAHSLLRRFRGAVVLRAYGGYPYTTSLGPLPARERPLAAFAASERFAFCPALPYQTLVEDWRISRRSVFWPACVTASRLGRCWTGAASDAVVCETIGLIDRYRSEEYARFKEAYGDLPLRILGQNPRGGPDGNDARIVGTLDDDAYYQAIAHSRVMIYTGLGSKYHLHYHPLEALMMGVPLIFFSSSALAHTALWMGISRETLRDAGMCEDPAQARVLAKRLLDDPRMALALSERQSTLRDLYRPERWDGVVADLVFNLSRSAAYAREHRDPSVDFRPPATVREAIEQLPMRATSLIRHRLTRLQHSRTR